MARSPEAQGLIRQAISDAGGRATDADLRAWTAFLENGGTVAQMRVTLKEKAGGGVR